MSDKQLLLKLLDETENYVKKYVKEKGRTGWYYHDYIYTFASPEDVKSNYNEIRAELLKYEEISPENLALYVARMYVAQFDPVKYVKNVFETVFIRSEWSRIYNQECAFEAGWEYEKGSIYRVAPYKPRTHIEQIYDDFLTDFLDEISEVAGENVRDVSIKSSPIRYNTNFWENVAKELVQRFSEMYRTHYENILREMLMEYMQHRKNSYSYAYFIEEDNSQKIAITCPHVIVYFSDKPDLDDYIDAVKDAYRINRIRNVSVCNIKGNRHNVSLQIVYDFLLYVYHKYVSTEFEMVDKEVLSKKGMQLSA